MGTNNPPILVELTPELADFLFKNCESNIVFGLKAIDPTNPTITSEDLVIETVQMLESFKAIRAAIIKAKEPLG